MEGTHSFKQLTTLRVGGDVADVLRPTKKQECVEIIKDFDAQEKNFLILGEGSNILAPDTPFDGAIVIPSFSDVIYEEVDSDTVRVVSDAGVRWDDLVLETVSQNLWGFENLSAIPGTVGAAPMQNIGAYGADIAQTCEWAEVYDRKDKTIKKLTNTELQFEYRTSVLKKERGRYIVLSVAFLLSKTPRPNISYKDLHNSFNGSAPTLQDIREAVIRIRKGKFPSLTECGTAGSFFLNPILNERAAPEFLEKYPNAPHFKTEEGVKIPLAWILDNIINAKGMRVGGAFVWEKQPLVIATDNTATSEDVRTLMKQLQKKVFEKTNIQIVPEVYVL